ncbi:enoyl-CoA hydratase/isomerase family protein [Streptomyces sp. NPDC026672]|uniref:enoyl-CoA hydratase/isomerase family protein n=1 Tax=unclassified Streptomyces TaxID=2593676 RepID=UPI0033FA60D1
MTEQHVTYTADGPVAHLRLARPGMSNAFDLNAARDLGKAVGDAASEAIRAVLVTGDGTRFCAGGDVASMAAAGDRASYVRELATALGDALLRLSRLEKPVVTAVQGAVAGAGLAVILSSDIVLAERSAKFLMAYAGVGLTPDCGVSYLLPRAVGQQRALELALTGRVLTAAEALEWGLVTEVVDDGTSGARALDTARRLAEGPGFALAQAKRLIRSAWHTPQEQHTRDEAGTIARAVSGDDATALINAFLTGSRTRRS